MPQFKESYLQIYLDDFKFLDPECHDSRVREINMRSKRCNRCKGFEQCKMHPHFWLYGDSNRLDENEIFPEDLAEAKAVATEIAPYQKVVKREPYDIPEGDLL